MNGYICFYKNKRCEVHANTALEANERAAKLFKARKTYDVTVVLAEKDNQPVVHSGAEF